MGTLVSIIAGIPLGSVVNIDPMAVSAPNHQRQALENEKRPGLPK